MTLFENSTTFLQIESSRSRFHQDFHLLNNWDKFPIFRKFPSEFFMQNDEHHLLILGIFLSFSCRTDLDILRFIYTHLCSAYHNCYLHSTWWCVTLFWWAKEHNSDCCLLRFHFCCFITFEVSILLTILIFGHLLFVFVILTVLFLSWCLYSLC